MINIEKNDIEFLREFVFNALLTQDSFRSLENEGINLFLMKIMRSWKN